jgi:glycine cleavage system regulatory protein
MAIKDVLARAEAYRRGLKKNIGRSVKFSVAGPVNMGLVEAMINLLQEQEKRIASLETQLLNRGR